MNVNGKNYNLNKQAKEILKKDIAQGNQALGAIFDALDKADGQLDGKLNAKNIVSIFKAIVNADKNAAGKNNYILSDQEFKKLKNTLLPKMNVSDFEFKSFIIKLLNINEYKYINCKLGKRQNGVRTIGTESVAMRESYHNQAPARINSQTGPVNERIDGFSQGKRGNCYMLAEINSIKNTAGGSKIFKDNITRYNNGSVKVRLPGAIQIKKDFAKDYPGKENLIEITGVYLITPEALKKAWKLSGDTYSEGDMDVVIYELAMESYRMELDKTRKNLKIRVDNGGMTNAVNNGSSNIKDILSGGYTWDAGFLITGKTSDVYTAQKDKIQNIKPYKLGEFGFITREEMNRRCAIQNKRTQEIHQLNHTETSLMNKLRKYSGQESKYSLTFGVKVAEDGPDGSTRAGGGHALSILKITQDTVYVLNPWKKDNKGKACIEPIPIDAFVKMTTSFAAQKIDAPQNAQHSNEQIVHAVNNLLKK